VKLPGSLAFDAIQEGNQEIGPPAPPLTNGRDRKVRLSRRGLSFRAHRIAHRAAKTNEALVVGERRHAKSPEALDLARKPAATLPTAFNTNHRAPGGRI
jgi:hypothetical protein